MKSPLGSAAWRCWLFREINLLWNKDTEDSKKRWVGKGIGCEEENEAQSSDSYIDRQPEMK